MNTFEIEQKYYCKNPALFRAKLKKLKARFIKKGSEVNEFWDFQGVLAKKKTVLRLRKHGKVSALTLKGPRMKSRYTKRVELETSVEFGPARAILKSLGFQISKKYFKKREIYQLGNIEVTVDTLPRLGSFVELEGSVNDIAKAERQLGLSARDREERSYLEMLFIKKG